MDNIEEKTIQSSEFDGNLLKAQALMWIICDGTKKWLRRIKKKKIYKNYIGVLYLSFIPINICIFT